VLGERYERAVVAVLGGDGRARAEAMSALDALGATAAVDRLGQLPRRRGR
jgi:hypothetical protein